MAVPWLAVGNLVLGNLDKILAVVRPGFTRRTAAAGTPAELVDQQIAELQAASAGNAEQIRQLAGQLREVVAALEQAAVEAAAQRAATHRLALIGLIAGATGCVLGAVALLATFG